MQVTTITTIPPSMFQNNSRSPNEGDHMLKFLNPDKSFNANARTVTEGPAATLKAKFGNNAGREDFALPDKVI